MITLPSSFPSATKAAIFSDLHIGKSKDSQLKLKAAKDFIQWMKASSKKNGCDIVIFLGDWFDNRNSISVETLNVGYQLLREISSSVPLILVVGNHDTVSNTDAILNSLNPFREIENVFVVDKVSTILIGNRRSVFFPWGSYQTFNPADSIFDFGFGHLEFNGAALCGGVDSSKIEQDSINEKAPLVFAGHYHIRKEYATKNGKLISVGSPLELDWGDYQDDKGYYVLDLASRQYEYVQNDVSPKHIKVCLSDIVKNPEILEILPIKNNYVRLVIDDKQDFVLITDTLKNINSKSPIKTCEPEYLFSTNLSLSEINIEKTIDSNSDTALTNLEYIFKYIDGMDEKTFSETVTKDSTKKTISEYYSSAEQLLSEAQDNI